MYLYVFKDFDLYLAKGLENNAIVKFDSSIISEINNHDIFFNKEYKEIIKNTFQKINKQNKENSFIIVTNTNCNLRCSYCYEKNICDTERLMIEEENNSIYEFIYRNIKKSDARIFNIEFTGGEPLLNKKYIFRLVNKINRNLKEKIIKYSLVTNGILLEKEDIKFFNDNKFNIQITLDGSKKFHNQERIGLNITNSFDIIIKNIKEYLNNSELLKITIRVNVSNKNKESIFELIDFLKIEFKNFINKSLSIYFDFLDVSNDDINFLEYFEGTKIIAEIYYYLFKNNINVPYDFNIAGNCMARNSTSVTITPEGKLLKCYSMV